MPQPAARYSVRPAPDLPIAELVIGRAPEEAAALLQRVFNLCGAAQGLAARLAMGLPGGADLRAEVVRDHLTMLCCRLPQALGLPNLCLPNLGLPSHSGTAPDRARAGVETCLFGPAGLAAAADFDGFLARGRGIAPLLRALPLRLGQVPMMVAPQGLEVFAEGAYDNSPAGRRQSHPLMQTVARRFGRGPLWRTLGRAIDATLPLPQPNHGPGWAVVPAARGSYGLRIAVQDGRVTALHRRTPTDHLLYTRGALHLALENLPSPDQAPLLLMLFDPCVAVEIAEVQHA